MVSGYHGSNPKADAQRVGAFDIIVKPYTDQGLREATRAAAESTDMNARTHADSDRQSFSRARA